MGFFNVSSGYIYVCMFYLIAVFLIYQGFKTNRLFFTLSALFLFLGTWYLIDNLIDINLFSSPYVWIFRGVLLLFLVFVIIVYILLKKKKIKDDSFDEEDK